MDRFRAGAPSSSAGWQNGPRQRAQSADRALVAWAKDHGCFVYIGCRSRDGKWPQSDWANPFKEGKHGDHATVVAADREYLEHSPGLKARLGELRGKVLGCSCHPLPCHGDVLCEAAE